MVPELVDPEHYNQEEDCAKYMGKSTKQSDMHALAVTICEVCDHEHFMPAPC